MSKTSGRNITIDCQDKVFGRVLTEVATKLMGKDLKEYVANIDFPTVVTLINYEHLIFTGKKMKSKVYYKHSGYIGNLKSETLEDKWKRDPQLVIKDSILGMLPKNKLQKNRIKRVKFIKD